MKLVRKLSPAKELKRTLDTILWFYDPAGRRGRRVFRPMSDLDAAVTTLLSFQTRTDIDQDTRLDAAFAIVMLAVFPRPGDPA
jgi:hypothetical protein